MALPLLSLSPVCLSLYLSAFLTLTFGGESGTLSYSCDGGEHFEWSIRKFTLLPSGVNDTVDSPTFRFWHSDWYLTIYPNGHSSYNSSGWFGVVLPHYYYGQRTLNLEYSLQDADGRATNTMRVTYNSDGSHNAASAKFMRRSEFLRRRDELVPDDTLTLVLSVGVGGGPSQTDVDNLNKDLRNLLLDGPGYDATFKLRDGEIRAHKAVLMARSPVFASMFRNSDTDKTEGYGYVICVDDCKREAFQQFLLYLYTGKVDTISLDNVFDLYKAAHKFNCPGLKTRCVRFMEISLSAGSTTDIMHLAAKHGETELLETATSFLEKNIEDVLASEWKHILNENPLAANELYRKSLKTCYDKN